MGRRKKGRPPLTPICKRVDVQRLLATVHQLAHDAYESNMYCDAVTKSLTLRDLAASEAALIEAAQHAARLKDLTKELIHKRASEQDVRNLRRA